MEGVVGCASGEEVDSAESARVLHVTDTRRRVAGRGRMRGTTTTTPHEGARQVAHTVDTRGRAASESRSAGGRVGLLVVLETGGGASRCLADVLSARPAVHGLWECLIRQLYQRPMHVLARATRALDDGIIRRSWVGRRCV
jgi:hypothetical protein